MNYRSAFEVRRTMQEEPSGHWQREAAGSTRAPIAASVTGGPAMRVAAPSSAELNLSVSYSKSMGIDAGDPTALVLEVPGAENIKALNASMKLEEEVQRHVESSNLSVHEMATYIMNNGSTTQRTALFQRLPELLADQSTRKSSQLFSILLSSMWVQNPELQCAAPLGIAQVLPTLESSLFPDVFKASCVMLGVGTAEVREAWSRLFLEMVGYMTTEQLEVLAIPLALKKTDHSEPSDQREFSCDLLGRLCELLDGPVIEERLLDRVTALCQDTDIGVRCHICAQLGLVARGVGQPVAKKRITDELAELLADEERLVARTAFVCLVGLVDFFDGEYRRERVFPMIRSFIARPPSGVLSLIVEEFGQCVLKLKEELRNVTDAILFANFYVNAAQQPDVETRRLCAFNLPAVVASFPVQFFSSHFSMCCRHFASDPSPAVRRPFAAGVHELIHLLGDTAAASVKDFFLILSRDTEERVRFLQAEHMDEVLRCFAQQLRGEERERVFAGVATFLLDLHATLSYSWRCIARVMEALIEHHHRFAEVTLVERFVPMLLSIVKSGAHCVKERSATALVKIASSLESTASVIQVIRSITNDLGRSSSCYHRIAYFTVMRCAVDFFSRRFVRERFVETALEMQRDAVPRVRVELARAIPLLHSLLNSQPNSPVTNTRSSGRSSSGGGGLHAVAGSFSVSGGAPTLSSSTSTLHGGGLPLLSGAVGPGPGPAGGTTNLPPLVAATPASSVSQSLQAAFKGAVQTLQEDENEEVQLTMVHSLSVISGHAGSSKPARPSPIRSTTGSLLNELEDERREVAEARLFEAAKEYDKAERRLKLRDLLRAERERGQLEPVPLRKGAIATTTLTANGPSVNSTSSMGSSPTSKRLGTKRSSPFQTGVRLPQAKVPASLPATSGSSPRKYVARR